MKAAHANLLQQRVDSGTPPTAREIAGNGIVTIVTMYQIFHIFNPYINLRTVRKLPPTYGTYY